jgi:hypothetical protein
MKITTEQLKKIIREEIRRINKEGYEHISKNMGYTKDQTQPSEYTNDGSGILAAEEDEKLKEAEEKWIQKAVKKPGQLHKDLGVPQGEKIPQSKLKAAAEKSGKVGQRARLALTLKGLK